MVRVGEDDMDEKSGPTSSKISKIEDRTLRSAAHNAVAISVQMLSESQKRGLVGSVLPGSAQVKKWHGSQRALLIYASNSKAGAVEPIGKGGIMQHVCSIVAELADVASLEKAGFLVPSVH